MEVRIRPFAAPGTVRVRPIAAGDRDGLMRFYAGLSPNSLEARFLGATPGIPEATARFFCGPDHEHREGLVAEAIDASGRRRIVGHLCLEPSANDRVEMALAVADAWRRRGIGRDLLDAAITWTRAHGITGLDASMRWSNGAILGLVRSTGLPVRFGAVDGGIIDLTLDLGAARRSAA
jgi:GNAT superfamily N-acetyltransferase